MTQGFTTFDELNNLPPLNQPAQPQMPAMNFPQPRNMALANFFMGIANAKQDPNARGLQNLTSMLSGGANNYMKYKQDVNSFNAYKPYLEKAMPGFNVDALSPAMGGPGMGDLTPAKMIELQNTLTNSNILNEFRLGRLQQLQNNQDDKFISSEDINNIRNYAKSGNIEDLKGKKYPTSVLTTFAGLKPETAQAGIGLTESKTNGQNITNKYIASLAQSKIALNDQQKKALAYAMEDKNFDNQMDQANFFSNLVKTGMLPSADITMPGSDEVITVETPQKAKPLTQKQLDDISTVTDNVNVISAIKKTYSDPSKAGLFGAGGFVRRNQPFAQFTDADVNIFKQDVDMFKQLVAKEVEKGRLSDSDRKFYQKTLFNPNVSQKDFISAINKYEGSLKNRHNNNLRVLGMGGYDVSGFSGYGQPQTAPVKRNPVKNTSQDNLTKLINDRSKKYPVNNQPTTSTTVKVKLPDGRTGSIPKSNLQKALKMGAMVIK